MCVTGQGDTGGHAQSAVASGVAAGVASDRQMEAVSCAGWAIHSVVSK